MTDCPWECWDETRRLSIARRFGSAMISNTDSTLLIYSTEHIRARYIKRLLSLRAATSAAKTIILVPVIPKWFGMNGEDDGTRTRGLCRDRVAG